MVGIIILFALGMSLVIKFIEKMTGFQEDDKISSEKMETNEATIVNEP